jgi:hypothetical protein
MAGQANEYLDAEKVAYWYLRLNGFFQMESFIVHPRNRGSQRTDADLLGIRFPHRAEHMLDDPDRVMQDDIKTLGLSNELTDVVIVEVKSRQQCSLNGPWSTSERQNVQRVLFAIGCLPVSEVEEAAQAIYKTGQFENQDVGIRVRLVAIGQEVSQDLAKSHPSVEQITWNEVFHFFCYRLNEYRNSKGDVKQWDSQIKLLQTFVKESRGDPEQFIAAVSGRLT